MFAWEDRRGHVSAEIWYILHLPYEAYIDPIDRETGSCSVEIYKNYRHVPTHDRKFNSVREAKRWCEAMIMTGAV